MEARARRLGEHLAVFAGFCLVSCAWSWPAAVSPLDTLPTRHFDAYPTLWLLARGPSALPDLWHAASAWPLGESLVRLDSYVLLALAALTRGILSPLGMVRLLVLLGPPINAFAAERLAGAGFDVPRPWSLLAGIAYGFSGIAGVAVLEGHVYHLLAPWLPLLWLAWRRGIAPGASAAWGLAVGAMFALSLLTTGYFGIFAAILLGMCGFANPVRGLRLLPGLALVAVPVGAWYLHVFSLGGGFGDRGPGPDLFLREGTQTVADLAGFPAWADLADHSMGAPLAWVPFWLLLLAPALLRRERGWIAPAILAILALVATLGRTIELAPGAPLLSWPAPPALPGLAFFRFPIRLSWLYTLAGGVVAARAFAALGGPRAAWGLLTFAVVDAVVGVALPWREGAQIGATPSVYAEAPADRAVLDLYGRPPDGSSGEVEPWVRGLGCAYQATHGRPILELCIGTGVRSPREVVEGWLLASLFDGSPGDDVIGTLAGLGVGAVVVHADWYREGDAAVLTDRLTELLGAAATSDDGGERVMLFRVPEGDATRAREVYRGIAGR